MKGSTHMSWGLGVGVQSQMKMSSLLINIIKNCKLSNITMTIMDKILHYDALCNNSSAETCK